MAKRLKVLIVDDEVIIQKLFKDFLQDEYEIASAKDGLEAMKFLESETVDVVFCDIHMPRMGGMEVLKGIKEKYSKLPVVMMDSFPEISSESMKGMGAFAFVHKPFYLREIRDVIREVISSGVSEPSFNGVEKRKERRLPTVLEVSYKIEDIDGHDFQKTLSKNISTSGILVETAEPLKKNMILILKLRPPCEKDRMITIRGQVKWCMEKRLKERYDTGVQFLENQEKELSEIRKLMGIFST